MKAGPPPATLVGGPIPGLFLWPLGLSKDYWACTAKGTLTVGNPYSREQKSSGHTAVVVLISTPKPDSLQDI